MRQDKFSQFCERLKQDPGLPLPNPTNSYWQQPPAEIATIQSSTLPKEADVVIIGSGISGCSISKHLLESDSSIKVVLLEARNVCSGATGRNGGNIKAVPELTYQALPADVGREVVNFTLGNVEAMIKMNEGLPEHVQKAGEVRRVETMNVFTTDAGFMNFCAAVEKFDAGVEKHRGRGKLVAGEELITGYGINNAVGAYVAHAGAAWPYRLITGIFSSLLQQHGARFSIEAQTPVLSIESIEGGSYKVNNSRGSIQAKTVIHATNGHAGHLLPGLRGPLFPIRGQMSTQAPTAKAEKYNGKRSWSLTYDHGFDYIIQSPSANEIFAGGGLAQSFDRGLEEIGNTDDSVDSVLSVAHLGGAMNAVFGIDKETAMSAGVKATWTGIMGFTSDGLPLVGRLPHEATHRKGDGEWVSAGFNGYGMVNCWLSGKHIAERVLGRDDPEPIPKAYDMSVERLQSMSAEKGAEQWVSTLGLD